MSTWGPHRAPRKVTEGVVPFYKLAERHGIIIGPNCDSCNDDPAVDCHDCELYQEAKKGTKKDPKSVDQE